MQRIDLLFNKLDVLNYNDADFVITLYNDNKNIPTYPNQCVAVYIEYNSIILSRLHFKCINRERRHEVSAQAFHTSKIEDVEYIKSQLPLPVYDCLYNCLLKCPDQYDLGI